MFRRIEDSNVKAGDKLMAPVDSYADPFYWQFNPNVPGHTWSDGEVRPNGTVLSSGGREIIVSKSYLYTHLFDLER